MIFATTTVGTHSNIPLFPTIKKNDFQNCIMSIGSATLSDISPKLVWVCHCLFDPMMMIMIIVCLKSDTPQMCYFVSDALVCMEIFCMFQIQKKYVLFFRSNLISNIYSFDWVSLMTIIRNKRINNKNKSNQKQ